MTLLLMLPGIFVVARAATATIFPVNLGPEASLKGEVVGTGGEDGTTYILSGQTSGIAFTRQSSLIHHFFQAAEPVMVKYSNAR